VKAEKSKEVGEDSKSSSRVSKLKEEEVLMINIGSTSLGGKVLSVKGDIAKL
jgi:translation initiation factor 2 subunit 3